MNITEQGKTFSQILKNSNTDEWYTPVGPVQMIVPYLKRRKFERILCPFDKAESNFVQVLKANGFNVTYSHIETGTDFFQISNLSDYDAIVSNPPYSKRQQILEVLYEAKVPFAMIMNYNGLFDNRKRWTMFKEFGVELLVPCGRIAFFNDTCEGKAPMFQSVYVCKGILDKQIEFEEMGKGQITVFDLL